MSVLRTLTASLLLLLAALFPVSAVAQDFPTKPIKLIVPFPAGGPNDIIARIVGQRMSELTRQPVIIDNRGGAGGIVATGAGLLVSSSTFVAMAVSIGSVSGIFI